MLDEKQIDQLAKDQISKIANIIDESDEVDPVLLARICSSMVMQVFGVLCLTNKTFADDLLRDLVVENE